MPESHGPFRSALFNNFPTDQPYPGNEKLQSHLFEQYKLYVELADRVSARRQTANSYFLTINTAILGFVGYVTTKDAGDYVWLLGFVGGLLCFFWHRLIRSYRDLNTAKFLVIHQIEKRLPISPYDAEWEAMRRGQDPKLYKPLTHIETAVPWVFALLHTLIFFRTIPWGLIVPCVK